LGDSHSLWKHCQIERGLAKVLVRLTGKNVYNLAMGGYGPNQYYYLLQTKAFGLKLPTIICGLYMGDDFDNAYRITYGLNYWLSLRCGGA
jgi:hypothetical protein